MAAVNLLWMSVRVCVSDLMRENKNLNYICFVEQPQCNFRKKKKSRRVYCFFVIVMTLKNLQKNQTRCASGRREKTSD